MLHVFGVFAGPCMPVVPGVPRVAVVTCVLAVPRVSVGLGGFVVCVVPVVSCVLGAPCNREPPTTHPCGTPCKQSLTVQ